jgi:hypothetical protein
MTPRSDQRYVLLFVGYRSDSLPLPQEMIRLVIRENGDFTPETLSTYIIDDVFKQAQRVEDSLSKVRQAMAAQVSVVIHSPASLTKFSCLEARVGDCGGRD